VVETGVTVVEPEGAATVPIPWLIDTVVALDTFQVRIMFSPGVIVEELAVKELTTGGSLPGVTPPQADRNARQIMKIKYLKYLCQSFFKILFIFIS
jgi:hypothetical protein